VPFSDEDIGAVMAQYQGVDQGALVERAEAIKARLDPAKAEEVGDRKILAKAAKDVMGAMRKQATDRAAAEEAKAQAREDESVSLVPAGDYVPDHAIQTREYIQKIAVINPETDFYYNKQTRRQTLNKRGLDKVAVAMQIHTEIKDIKVLDDRLIVVARGWIGDKDTPAVVTEDAADFVYTDMHNDYVFEQVSKEKIPLSDFQMDSEGRLWVREDIRDAVTRNIFIRKAVHTKRNFAMRATISKARERVIRTLSGTCDLDDEEAKMLEREYRQVAGVTA